jgi:hypothetical protein
MHTTLNSCIQSHFASVQEIFSVRQKVDWILWLEEVKSSTHVHWKFNYTCTWAKQNQLTDLWCIGTNVWDRRCPIRTWSAMPYGFRRLFSMNTRSISKGPLQVYLRRKFTITHNVPNCSWYFAQKTEISCLQALVGPKDNTQRSRFKKAVCFINTFQHWRGWDLPWQTVFLMKQHFLCEEQSVLFGQVKILMKLLNMNVIHWRSMCGVLWWETKLWVLYFLKNLWWLATLFWLLLGTVLCIRSL